MKIVFKTQVDAYKTNCWPENLTQVPRIGDTIVIKEAFGNHFSSRNLPLRMEVKDVSWMDLGVVCELHYKEIDIKIAAQNKTNLYP